MKTFFIEIVYNNNTKTSFEGTIFLRAVINAKNKEEAEKIAINHYSPHYTAGVNGVFKVQCSWEVNIPTREVVEKYWKIATGSLMPLPVHNKRGRTIGYRKIQADTTKQDVLDTWDYCNSGWANPSVYYEPLKGGYIVALHNYGCLRFEFKLFKGATGSIYKKAQKWVKDNTFKGSYFRPFIK